MWRRSPKPGDHRTCFVMLEQRGPQSPCPESRSYWAVIKSSAGSTNTAYSSAHGCSEGRQTQAIKKQWDCLQWTCYSSREHFTSQKTKDDQAIEERRKFFVFSQEKNRHTVSFHSLYWKPWENHLLMTMSQGWYEWKHHHQSFGPRMVAFHFSVIYCYLKLCFVHRNKDMPRLNPFSFFFLILISAKTLLKCTLFVFLDSVLIGTMFWKSMPSGGNSCQSASM